MCKSNERRKEVSKKRRERSKLTIEVVLRSFSSPEFSLPLIITSMAFFILESKRLLFFVFQVSNMCLKMRFAHSEKSKISEQMNTMVQIERYTLLKAITELYQRFDTI